MNEADWKRYSALVPVVRERYLADRNRELAVLLANPSKAATERFWEAEETMRATAKILSACFGSYSRSNMYFSLMLMIGHGLLTPEDTTGFGAELKSKLDMLFAEKEAANHPPLPKQDSFADRRG